jgi:outer membrane protein OmpA-like peptidoglycan-associated protein
MKVPLKTGMLLLVLPFCLAAVSIVHVDAATPIRLIGDFWSCPVQYEFSQSSFHTTFNGSLFLGARIQRFTVGGSLHEHYYSLGNGSPQSGLAGGENMMRVMADGFYEPVDWFELHWALGVSWLSSAFDYRVTGEINQQKVGVGFNVDATFRPPWKYVQFRLINRLDLMVAIDTATADYDYTSKLIPFYYAGGRVDFHPWYQWINLYIEIGGGPWVYTSYPASFVTGRLFISAGIAIDMTFPRTITEMKRPPVIRPRKNVIRTVKKAVEVVPVEEPGEDVPVKLTSTEIEVIKEETVSDRIRKVLHGDKGDVIVFTEINFYPDSADILDSSFSMLNDLADALIDRKDILRFDIAGHTNSLGSPVEEKELSIERANMVARYLEQCGISPKRITTSGYGGMRTMVDGIDVINRRVELKILRVKGLSGGEGSSFLADREEADDE